ncbi:MAG: Gfo/Idh/MocA family oxidoreductase [Armatimonadetes bacterium]|nr:Gfo/Idh/MocA family oxidoreductase [Armatimonadota bacterium]
MSINVCVVGYGSAFGMGHHHAEWVRNTEGMELAGVCEPDPQRRQVAAETEDVPTWESMDEVIADDSVDMVALIVPHNLHAPLAIQALEAGKHVITEKPMCVTVEEADAMIVAARKADRCLTVYHNRRWDPDFVTVKHMIDEGLLGEVFLVEAHVGAFRPLKGWRCREEAGGGMLRDWGAHVIDQCVQIAGSPAAKVFAQLEHRVWTDVMDVPTHNQLFVQFESGVWADISLSNNAFAPRPRWRVLGEKGGLIKEAGGGGVIKYFHEVAGQQCVTDYPCLETDLSELYQNVADHINKGVELLVKPEDVRPTIAIFDAAYASAETGEAVEPA